MVLIVGGRSSGKRAYLLSHFPYHSEDISDIPGKTAVLTDLQKFVWENFDKMPLDALFDAVKRQEAVLCDEVGCGIVPVDKRERDYRETVGRLCCMLAERADTVIRVTCGIGQIIRGEAVC